MRGRQRASGSGGYRRRVEQPGEGHDVAGEQQREHPVVEHPQPAGGAGGLHQVDAAGGEPAREAAHPDPVQVGDSVLAAEGGDLAERAEAVGLHRPSVLGGQQVGGQAAALSQSVLAGGRVELPGRGSVRYRGAVSQGPDIRVAVHLERGGNADPAPLVEGKPELGDDRIGLHAGRPHQQSGVHLGTVAERHPAVGDLDEPGAQPQSTPHRLSMSATYRPSRDGMSARILRGRVDQHPPLRYTAQGGVIPERVLGQATQLRQGFDPGVATAHEYEREIPAPVSGIRFDRRRGQQPQQLIAQVKSVEDRGEAHGMVGQPGDREQRGEPPRGRARHGRTRWRSPGRRRSAPRPGGHRHPGRR